MNKLVEKLAAIKPQGEGDFAYKIQSAFLSDTDHHFYCNDLLEGLKEITDKEQEILSSDLYYAIYDENLLGYYNINGQDFYLNDLADRLKDVKTNKKILFNVWGPGYDVHDIVA